MLFMELYLTIYCQAGMLVMWFCKLLSVQGVFLVSDFSSSIHPASVRKHLSQPDLLCDARRPWSSQTLLVNSHKAFVSADTESKKTSWENKVALSRTSRPLWSFTSRLKQLQQIQVRKKTLGNMFLQENNPWCSSVRKCSHHHHPESDFLGYRSRRGHRPGLAWT